ncbi:heme-binding protein [Thiocapsa imhoffii]|uniref:Heme-binding protein n=2 Tax=Thiocapsa imhoffii TaxID=382777 RepID=A0A9X1B9G4_9GAMM|nr:heme-binding protein [Thiocapsa imhoffii]
MAIETPDYRVLRQTPAFEIRRYDTMRLAEVEVGGDFERSGGEAFRLLAGYIFGDNASQQRMAMTAPVSQQPAAAREQTHRYSFVMPAPFTLETLPAPNNPRVRLREQPAQVVAVRRYRGSWSESRYREEEALLLSALAAAGITPRGPTVYARYNSPFSLPFLRRNEVMVEIEMP